MATYALQFISLANLAAPNLSEGSTEIPPNGAATFKGGDLVIVSGGTANNLTNGAVANLALAYEDAVDTAYRAAGPGFGTTKPFVGVLDLNNREIIISAGGAAFSAATHVGASRGVKIDASGRSYIDLTDSTNLAFRIKRLLVLPLRDTVTGNFFLPKDGDTNVPVVAQALTGIPAVI